MTPLPSDDELSRLEAINDELFSVQYQLGEVLAEHIQLTPTQMFALFVIDRMGEAKSTDIGKVLDLTSGALTSLMDRMEDQGLVRRRRSEADRRLVLLSLTDEGRARMARGHAYKREMNQRFLQALAPEERAQLLASLECMARIWKTQIADGSLFAAPSL